MVLGIVCYGYVVASVAAALANADAQRARYREKLDAIRTFMDVRSKTTRPFCVNFPLGSRFACGPSLKNNEVSKLCDLHPADAIAKFNDRTVHDEFFLILQMFFIHRARHG